MKGDDRPWVSTRRHGVTFNLVLTTIRCVIVGGAKLTAGPGRATADATTLVPE